MSSLFVLRRLETHFNFPYQYLPPKKNKTAVWQTLHIDKIELQFFFQMSSLFVLRMLFTDKKNKTALIFYNRYKYFYCTASLPESGSHIAGWNSVQVTIPKLSF